MTRLVPEASRLQSHAEEIAKRGTSPLSRFLKAIDDERALLIRKKDLPLMDYMSQVVDAMGRIIEARDRYNKEAGL